MGKLFYLIGKSSSGKDTLFKKLLDSDIVSLHKFVSYTTRPIREGEQEGVEYHFVTEENFVALDKEGKVVECRSYDTIHGIWRYFTVNDGNVDFDHGSYLTIGTLESYIKTRDFFGEKKVIPIYIDLDDGQRLERALLREKNQASPKYEEMCRRFLADSKDFSEENLKLAGINKIFLNNELEQCYEEVLDFIRNYN